MSRRLLCDGKHIEVDISDAALGRGAHLRLALYLAQALQRSDISATQVQAPDPSARSLSL